MPGINHTVIQGNLTRDPELRVTQKGTAVTSLTVANNRTWKDESDQEREEVIFLDATAWGKTAETIAKYFAKGDPIILEGYLKMESWEDKTSGQKRTKIKLNIDRFHFCGKTSGIDSHSEPGAAGRQDPPAERKATPPPPAQQERVEDDVPF